MFVSTTANGEEVGLPEHVRLGHQERLRKPRHLVHHARGPSGRQEAKDWLIP